MNVQFKIINQADGSQARRGVLKTQNAELETPIFMPVGTHAAVRGQQFSTLNELHYKLLLANTYHLLLRPGIPFLKEKGGIRGFTKWPHGFLTDSGGFQIFSLSKKMVINDHAATFQSHIDGRTIVLTPELSIEAQRAFGSDIMMVLDECVPSTSSHEVSARAIHRSFDWAKRSFDARGDSKQGLFGIVQGALFEDLRRESATQIMSIPFDGYAIGGLAVGEGKQDRESMTELVTALLPKDKPRYLMGVGTPMDILEAVHRGVDMFDCVLPTLLGQQGVAFFDEGKIDLRKTEFRTVDDPISAHCSCPACRLYSRGYLHHLIKTYDITAEVLVAQHNLYYYASLMERIRTALKLGTFESFYREQKGTQGENSRYEITKRTDKDNKVFGSIRHKGSGEHMHSSEKPWVESQRLYIEQSKLEERIRKGPLVIWDVGLGGATNAMGAVECYERLKRIHRNAIPDVTMLSFENDLEPLTLSLSQKELFPHLRHPAPQVLQREQVWESNGFTWKLFYGDFQDFYGSVELPDVIFFDPFSYKVDSPLWSYKFFKELYQVVSQKPCVAFTFSASTAVRASLLAAGFHVAQGWSTGQKKETTVFMTPLAASKEPYPFLDGTWLQKWKKSDARIPTDITPEIQNDFINKIQNHPQFQ